MLKPIRGVLSVVPSIDHIVEHRPYLRPVVFCMASAEADEARGFIDGYSRRCYDLDDRALVPNAHVRLVAVDASNAADGFVDLVDEIADQLRSSVPAGAGRGWQLKQYNLCLDVIQAQDTVAAAAGAAAARKALRERLQSQWEGRNKLLSPIRRMGDSDLLRKILGAVLMVIVNETSRWWFGRRLNRRGLRWFREHVRKVTGRPEDFLGQALRLFPGRGVDDIDDIMALRKRILFDALLRDVALFTRRHRFLPHRRRRRWTPVLLLDATGPLGAELIKLFDELTAKSKVMPLLVMAAVDASAAAASTDTSTQVVDIDEAAPVLNALIKKQHPDPPRRLVMCLSQDPPLDPDAKRRLEAKRCVTPDVPGTVRAWAPLGFGVAAIVAVVVAVPPIVLRDPSPGGCADTKINSLGERVGVIESGCSFDINQPDFAGDAPKLSDLEQQLFANNSQVDKEQRYYRKVVFFAPLTRPPKSPGERTAPPNAIWQLRGAVEWQHRHNEAAKVDNDRVLIKLILANSGDRFDDGDWVAAKIAARPQSSNADLAAVIGISQSRQVSSDAIRRHLTGNDIPVIGASMYGSRMTENNNVFLSAPLNKAFATRMISWLQDQGAAAKAAVVYDPDDPYFSRELRYLLHDQGIGSTATDIETEEDGTFNVSAARLAAMCNPTDRQVPVLAGRADQILKFLQRANEIESCTKPGDAGPVPILAGPGLIVEAANGTLATKFPWARITMTSLKPTAAKSEEYTGETAFRIASAAIDEARRKANEQWGPTLVTNTLKDDQELLSTFGLPKPNDDTDISRISLIDLT